MDWDPESELWNVDLWSAYLADSTNKEVPVARAAYERFLQQFPTAGRVWTNYVNLELRHQEYERVERIFARCLRHCLHIDLWKSYISYVKIAKETQLEQAYEYAVSMIGLDISSSPIWLEYIAFLRAQQSNVTLDAIRHVYMRAVVSPIQNIEAVWKDYDSFENTLNKLTAKKILGERSSAYMTARAAYRERRTLFEQINRSQLARPPRGISKEDQQFIAWRSLIAWEKANPLHLDDSSILQERILFAYKQALLYLRFYPDVWYDAAAFLSSCGRSSDAIELLGQSFEAMPTSLFLRLSWADIQENLKNYEYVKIVYENAIQNLENLLNAISATKEKAPNGKLLVDRNLQWLQNFISAEEGNHGQQIRLDNEGSDTRKKEILKTDGDAQQSVSVTGSASNAISGEKDMNIFLISVVDIEKYVTMYQYSHDALVNFVDTYTGLLSLAYISYMRFARRSEGRDGMRQVFKRARGSVFATYHIVAASAWMEYFCYKETDIASRIFSVFAAKYGDQPGFVLQYVDYLSHVNDDNNIRALFEKSLSTIPSEKAKELWNSFVAFETKYGELASISKIETRRTDAYPNLHPQILNTLDRHRYLDLLPCKEWEFNSIASRSHKQSILLSVAVTGGRDTVPHKAAPVINLLESVDVQKFIRPEVSKMIPFKPERQAFTYRPSLPQFLQTPAFAALGSFLLLLPPANLFAGPILNVDEVLELAHNFSIPSSFLSQPMPAPLPIPTSTSPTSTVTSIGETPSAPAAASSRPAVRRPHGRGKRRGNGSDSEPEITESIPTALDDVYRQRQQKRLQQEH